MKPFISITRSTIEGGDLTPLIDEFATEEAARDACTDILRNDASATVKIYRLVAQARAETVVKFDGGLNGG